jgi:hypothetical protein
LAPLSFPGFVVRFSARQVPDEDLVAFGGKKMVTQSVLVATRMKHETAVNKQYLQSKSIEARRAET